MKKNLLLIAIALLCSVTLFAAQKKVAFVYQTGYNASRYVWDAAGYIPALDPIHAGLLANFEVTDFVYAQTEIPDTTLLKTFDMVFMCEAMAGGQNLSNTMKALVGKVPLLNLKAYVYTSGRWSWAPPSNPAARTTSVSIIPGFENHAIFKDVVVTDGAVQIYDGSNTSSNMIQGFGAPIAGGLIQPENIIANVTGTTTSAIHEITGLPFRYMMIPLSSDLITTVSPNGVKLVINACNYVMGGNSGGFDPGANFKIAYLYDGAYSGYCGIDNDPLYNNSVIAEKDCEAINISTFTATSTDTLAALEKYDLVVVSEAMSSGHAFAKPLLSLVNRVPMLNFKSFFYKSSVWNWGAGVNPTAAATVGGVDYIKVDTASLLHPLFTDVEIVDTCVTMFRTKEGIVKNLMQGYTASVSGLIASDKVIASVVGTTASYNAIHEHGTSNKYMLIPISSDAMYVNDEINLTDGALQMVNNAVYYLIESKSNVLPAQKPTFALEYGNGVTKVIISTVTTEAKIYYTTNGAVPTKASSLYSDTLSLTTDCTLKAFTTKQGYNDSPVDSVVIVVKNMAVTPTIIVTAAEVGKLVTLSGAEGAILYYTTSGATPSSAKSTLYSAPFVVTRPCTVKAIAEMTDKLPSEVAMEQVSIDGYILREKQLTWANFNTVPTTWVWANTDTTTTDNGDVIAKYAYNVPTVDDPDLVPIHKTVNFNNGFVVGSYGQRINLQKTGIAVTGNYSPETDGDAGATDRAMSFLTTNSSADPTNAYLATDSLQAGPFDVVVWFTGAKGNVSYVEKLEVSVSPSNDSSATWTVLDTLTAYGDKLIRKRIAYYDATTPVYVKLTSATNLGTSSNMMIFDVKLFGEGPAVSVKKPATTDKTVVSTKIYTITGLQVRRPITGLNIIRTIYSDGSVKVQKIMVKDTFAY